MALTAERQSTRAWSLGAIGEERVGAAVDAIAGQSIRELHDRKIPRSKANIDHLVVTPGGVWVIDSKRYQDRRPELRVEGGILRPRVEKLLVRGQVPGSGVTADPSLYALSAMKVSATTSLSMSGTTRMRERASTSSPR